ncbi:hypothetical protein EK904_009071 [Melospiza melodia maxima]|nr:hypothetical protein EK904_009071 [Melospiza melodia maxima]
MNFVWIFVLAINHITKEGKKISKYEVQTWPGIRRSKTECPNEAGNKRLQNGLQFLQSSEEIKARKVPAAHPIAICAEFPHYRKAVFLPLTRDNKAKAAHRVKTEQRH